MTASARVIAWRELLAGLPLEWAAVLAGALIDLMEEEDWGRAVSLGDATPEEIAADVAVFKAKAMRNSRRRGSRPRAVAYVHLRRLTAAQIAEARRLHETGETWDRIGRRLGVAGSTVTHAVRDGYKGPPPL